MTDEIDVSSELDQFAIDASVNYIRSKVANIPEGTPGECDKCGEDSPRLVNGVCCRCRDKFKLK